MAGSFIFMLVDYYFQGLTYIIVYVGAIAILFQFVIMMVHIPILSTKTSITYSPQFYQTQDKETQILTTNIKQKNNNLSFYKIISLGFLQASFWFLLRYLQYFFVLDKQMQIGTYFYINWTQEFITLMDIETQGYMTYIGYPIVQIQIGLAQWVVQIGIISICTERKSKL